MTWRDQAVCYNDQNPSYWVSYDLKKIKYAKRGCSQCPVISQCLIHHAGEQDLVGVIGGISEYDRLLVVNKESDE